MGEVHPHDGAVHQIVELGRGARGTAARGRGRGLRHLEDPYATFRTARPEPAPGIEDPGAPSLAVERVLLEVQPQVAEGIRRVVGVGNPLLAPDRAGRRVERGANDVVHPLLPVVGPRRAAAGADRVGRGQLEPPEGRRIGGAGEARLLRREGGGGQEWQEPEAVPHGSPESESVGGNGWVQSSHPRERATSRRALYFGPLEEEQRCFEVRVR